MPLLAPVTATTVSDVMSAMTGTTAICASLFRSAAGVRARRLDPFAGYLMLNFGLSLAVGVATSDARLLLAGNTLVNGIGGIFFLGSCAIGKPLTKVIAERVCPVGDEDEPGEAEFKHRVHILLSAMWGIGMVLHLIVIFTLPVDVANAVGTAMSLVLMAIFITATVAVVRRARARWEQRSPAQG